jgi:hypothetical protein
MHTDAERTRSLGLDRVGGKKWARVGAIELDEAVNELKPSPEEEGGFPLELVFR